MIAVPGHLAGIAGAANSALRQIGSALGPAIFGAILTTRTVSALPGHLAGSGLGTGQQGQVMGMITHAGIQAGAFLHVGSPSDTEAAHTAYGMSFTSGGLHTCALVGGIGMLTAAAVALTRIGVRNENTRTAPKPVTDTPLGGPPPPAATP